MHLKDKNGRICSCFGSGDFDTGTCTVILELSEGHELWVENPSWAGTAKYNQHYNYFTGHLLKRQF